MKEVILRELAPTDEVAFFNAIKDWEGEDLNWITFEWRPGISFVDHLERLRKNKFGLELPGTRVPSSMLYGFVADEIIGRVNVRHELNSYLLERGGHIGYAISPRFRGQGLGRKMVAAVIPYLKNELGLKRVLITCAEDNLPSVKIIEFLGGKLEDKFIDTVEGETVCRYWIEL